MDEDKNKTGGVWMRTPPVYDLEQVTRLYQRLRDVGDDLGPEELRYAPDEVRRTVKSWAAIGDCTFACAVNAS